LRVFYENLYLNREKEGSRKGKLYESNKVGNPPPVDLGAVCYIVSNKNMFIVIGSLAVGILAGR
jgi:hypothetical protein